MGLGYIGGGARGPKRSIVREAAKARGPWKFARQQSGHDAAAVRAAAALASATGVAADPVGVAAGLAGDPVDPADAADHDAAAGVPGGPVEAADAVVHDTATVTGDPGDADPADTADPADPADPADTADLLRGVGRRLAALEQRFDQLLGPDAHGPRVPPPHAPEADPTSNGAETTRWGPWPVVALVSASPGPSPAVDPVPTVAPPARLPVDNPPPGPVTTPAAAALGALLVAALATPRAVAHTERPLTTPAPPPLVRQFAVREEAEVPKYAIAAELTEAVRERRARLGYED